jgi:hypothetical protein
MRDSTTERRAASGLESLSGNGGDRLAPPVPVRDRAGHYRRNPAAEWDPFYCAPDDVRRYVRRHLFASRGAGIAVDQMADLAGFDDVNEWWSAVITAASVMREHERVNNWETEELEDDNDLVAPAELAALLGVSRDTLRTWRMRGQLPPPDFTLDGDRCPVWTLRRVRDWAAATGRTLEVSA